MTKLKSLRATPKSAGSRVYGHDDLAASLGNSVYKHLRKYHVFVGRRRVLVTEDLQAALTEAARKPAL